MISQELETQGLCKEKRRDEGFKGTRVDIIAQINAWIDEKEAPPVYWLAGLAGVGKTTIAHTIRESLHEARLPLTSFFCSLQLDSRNSKHLVTKYFVPEPCRTLQLLRGQFFVDLGKKTQRLSVTACAS